jgi:hypothetical protein
MRTKTSNITIINPRTSKFLPNTRQKLHQHQEATMPPPRRPIVHIASDDPEFDPDFLSALQTEGFETTYIPIITKPNAKADLTPLRHIADDLERGELYSLIAFGSAATACLDFYAEAQPHCAALISYYPTSIANPLVKFPTSLRTATHLASSQNFKPAWANCFTYDGVLPGFAEQDLEEFDRIAAELAWSRTLGVLRAAFGIEADLERVWEEHQSHVESRDAGAVVRSFVPDAEEAHVNYVPTMTGGIGQEDLFIFYRDYFMPSTPPSTSMRLVSRTIGVDRVVDEMVLSFEHTQVIPWMLPDVPPTGRSVSIAVVAIVCIRGGKLCHENVYWDQASVLVQIGLLDPKLVPKDMKEQGLERLPVVGVEAARKVLDVRAEQSNGLLSSWKKRSRGDPGAQMPVRPKQAASVE